MVLQSLCLVDDDNGPHDFGELCPIFRQQHLISGEENVKFEDLRPRIEPLIFTNRLTIEFVALVEDDVELRPALDFATPVKKSTERHNDEEGSTYTFHTM